MRRAGSIIAAVSLVVTLLSSVAVAAETLEALFAELEIIALPAAAPPAFKLASLDGTSVALGDFRGRPALLYFWATW